MKRALAAAALLPYVNLLLMMLAGAGLATAVRLQWDPSASIPLQLLLPREYRVTSVLLTACPLALLLLGMLAQAGLHSRARRRATLLTYASGMVLLMIGEVATGAWLAVRVHRFVTEDPLVPELLDLLRVADQLRAELNQLLHKLDRVISISKLIEDIFRKLAPQLTHLLYSDDLERLLQEIPSDLPCNLFVGAACVLLCGALQPLAVLLAWLAARPAAPALRAAGRQDYDTLLLSRVSSTKGPQDKVSNMPRCLRPMSIVDKVADDLPLATGRSKDKEARLHSLRTAPRSRGWQLQPGADWSRQ